MYVGTAKIRPDSLIPRRFATLIRAMSPSPRITRWSTKSLNAGIDTMAATPAEIETATVRM